MRNLLFKEFNLSIHKFFLLLPFLLGALAFIPQWIFSLMFMYFIWITVPNLFGTYNSQNDYMFLSSLPVDKTKIVKSKIYAVIILELLHIVAAVIFSLANNHLYGMFNWALDLNYAFYGLIFVVYALFNIIFLPMYFKTAYHYGLPLIISTVVTTAFVVGIELLNIFNKPFNNLMEQSNVSVQLMVLLAGITVFAISNVIAIRKSTIRFMKVN